MDLNLQGWQNWHPKAPVFTLPIRIHPGKKAQMNATTDCCADSFPRVSVWQGTRRKTLLTWPIGPIRCREKSWATGHRRSCLTKNWTESTPSDAGCGLFFLRSGLRPSLQKNKPPSQRSSLVKTIATCYCNSPKKSFEFFKVKRSRTEILCSSDQRFHKTISLNVRASFFPL